MDIDNFMTDTSQTEQVPPLPTSVPAQAPTQPPAPSPVIAEESKPLPTEKHTNKSGLVLIIGSMCLLAGIALGFYIAKNPNYIAQLPNISKKQTISSSKEPLVIGAIIPLTGDASNYGVPIQQTAFLTQNEINKSGGINGRQLKIIWENGRCEHDEAKAAAEKLINNNKVSLLFAGVCSDEFLAAAPVAQAKKVISFTSSATSPKISELGKYIFRTAPSDAVAGKVAAQYAFNKWHAKTAGIIAENKTYTLALRDVFKNDFTALGGSVVLDETFDTGTTDFTKISDKVASANLDVVYILPQTPTPGVLLITALKNRNVTVRMLTAEVLLERDALQKQGKILEGVTGIEALVDETRPKAQHFIDIYKKEYSSTLTYPPYMLGMYDAIYLIKEAYEKVGNDPEAVSNYIHSLKNWNGAVGALTFSSNGDPTFSYSIRTISNGTAPQVDVYTPK